MPNQWGRGTYGQGGDSLGGILAEMAEKARMREEQQKQEAAAQQRMQHEKMLSDREIQARIYGELIRNTGDPRAWEIAKMQGVSLPNFRQLPMEEARDVSARAGMKYLNNPSRWSPGFEAANAFQTGTGAAMPAHVQQASITQDTYTRPNVPPQMVESADIAGGRKMSAKQTEDARVNALRAVAQNAADYARARASNAKAGGGGGGGAGGVGQVAESTDLVTAPSATGDEFLETLDAPTASLVKKIANYEMDIAKVTSLRGGERERVAKLVAQYDPTFDMTQYGARAAARKDLTSGMTYRNLTRLNQVVHHLKNLDDAGNKLENFSGIPLANTWINKAKNKAAAASGDPALNNFETARNAVVTEMAAIYKGTAAPTEQEIKEWGNSVHYGMSKEQRKAAIATMVDLMKGRLSSLNQQYVTAMGKPRDFGIIQPESRKIIESFGLTLDDVEPAGKPSGSGSGGGYTAAQEAGIAAAMKASGKSRDEVIAYLRANGKL